MQHGIRDVCTRQQHRVGCELARVTLWLLAGRAGRSAAAAAAGKLCRCEAAVGWDAVAQTVAQMGT